jgi:APA family basic amino acid/polyamine antiporter
MANPVEPQELQRRFGMPTATFVVIASMVGTGILVSPGYAILALESYSTLLLLWAIGGVLAVCGALTIAELAAAMPRAGGEYVYLREAYGPLPGFLAGWTSFFLGFSAPLAINAHLAATYLLSPIDSPTAPAAPWLRTALGACLIVAVTVPNVLGYRHSAWTQNLTTLIKLSLLGGVVVVGFAIGNGKLEHLSGGKPLTELDYGVASTQLFYIMIAYTGWNAAGYVAGEVRTPGRTLPRSILLGCGLVVVLYLAMNLVFAYALPVADATAIADAERFALIAVARLFGDGAASVFAFAVGLALLATLSAFVVTGPRIYYAMARDGLFPALAGVVHPRTGLPVQSIVLQSACALAILSCGTFQQVYQYTAVGLSLFSMLFISAVFVLRVRRPELARPFRTPGYPVVPAVYLLATLWMVGCGFQQWPGPSTVSLLSILAGVPIYFLWTRIRQGKGSPPQPPAR